MGQAGKRTTSGPVGEAQAGSIKRREEDGDDESTKQFAIG